MRPIVTYEGIDEALKNLHYTNKNALKTKLINIIREQYSLFGWTADSVGEIDTDYLVKTLWETGDDPALIRSRRKNFNSIKSTVNTDLKKLYSDGLNKEGIIINQKNIFDMSDEAKSEMLEAFSYGGKGNSQIPLDKITDVLSVINDFISNKEAGIESNEKFEQLKELIKDISGKVGISIVSQDSNASNVIYAKSTEAAPVQKETTNEDVVIVQEAEINKEDESEEIPDEEPVDEIDDKYDELELEDLPEEELDDSNEEEVDVVEEPIDDVDELEDVAEEELEEIPEDEVEEELIDDIEEAETEEIEEIPEDEIVEEPVEEIENDELEELEEANEDDVEIAEEPIDETVGEVDEFEDIPEEDLEELPEDALEEEPLDDDIEEVPDDEFEEIPEEEIDEEPVDEIDDDEFEEVEVEDEPEEELEEANDDDVEIVEEPIDETVDEVDELEELPEDALEEELLDDDIEEVPDDEFEEIPEEEIDEEPVDEIEDDEFEEVEVEDGPEEELEEANEDDVEIVEEPIDEPVDEVDELEDIPEEELPEDALEEELLDDDIEEVQDDEFEEIPEEEIDEEPVEEIEDDELAEVDVEDVSEEELEFAPEDDVEIVEEPIDEPVDEVDEFEDIPEEELEELPEDALEEELLDDMEEVSADEVDLEEAPEELEEVNEDDVEIVEEPLEESLDDVDEVEDIPEEELEEIPKDEIEEEPVDEPIIEFDDLDEIPEDELEEVPEDEIAELLEDDDYTLEKILEDYDTTGYQSEEGQEKALILADRFDKMLSDTERYYNRYLLVPGGRFLAVNAPSKADSKNKNYIELPDFYFGKFPVTNNLFELFVEKTGYVTTAERLGYGIVYKGRYRYNVDEKSGRKILEWNSSLNHEKMDGACWYQPHGPGSTVHGKRNYPVVQVTLEDAMAFAAWTGKRLPTEQEWEAAARTSSGLDYPWGKKPDKEKCNVEASAIGDTTPVEKYQKAANKYEIYDLLGNVLEWTASSESQEGNVLFIAKGGSWVSGENITLISKSLLDPKSPSNIVGFRCITYK